MATPFTLTDRSYCSQRGRFVTKLITMQIGPGEYMYNIPSTHVRTLDGMVRNNNVHMRRVQVQAAHSPIHITWVAVQHMCMHV